MGVESLWLYNIRVVSAMLKVDAVKSIDSAVYRFLATARLEK